MSEFDSAVAVRSRKRKFLHDLPEKSRSNDRDFELSKDGFIKGSRELAIAASFSLKSHIVDSLRRTAGPLLS